MVTNPDRSAYAAKKRRNDADFYRMTLLFFALAAILLLLLRASANIAARHASGANTAYNLYKIFHHPAGMAAVGILLAASTVWFIVCRVRKKDESTVYFSSTNALLLSAYLVFFALFFGTRVVNRRSECIFMLCVTAALAALYYIFKLYHFDFFVFSAENALLAVLLYRYHSVYGVRGIVGKALLVLVGIYVGLYLRSWFGKHGASRFGKKGTMNRRGALIWPYFVSLGLFAVFMFIKLPDPTAAPLIPSGTMLTAMVIQYALFAIRYTIRLIRE